MDAIVYDSLGAPGDTADAAGSVHAQVADLKNRLDYGVVPRTAIASTVTKYQDLEEVQYAVGAVQSAVNVWTEWTRLRAARIFFNGTIRVIFDAMKTEGSCRVDVFINKEGRGTMRTALSSEAYETYTEDFYVAYGDDIAIYGGYTASSPGDIKIQNFYIKFDVANAASSGVTKIY